MSGSCRSMRAPAGRSPAARGAFIAIAALVGAFVSAPVHANDAQGTQFRIATLNSADPYLPAFVALDRAMRDEVRTKLGLRAEFYVETLDMLRFPRALFERETVALLRKKYRDLKVDVVVAAGTTALEFAERHGDEIWPGAAIVFEVVPDEALRGRTLGPRTTGTPIRVEIGPTVALALQLWPATHRVTVVGGTTEFDRNLVTQARAALEPYAGRLGVEYLVDLSLPAVLAAVRALPPDAMVLYLSMYRDGAGEQRVPLDVVTQIAAASSVPMFGIFEPSLGRGVVAGWITSNQAQGRRTGELVTRLLNGEPPSGIGVQPPVPPACIADWRQLRRWDINERRLPDGCEVRFRELTAWELYRWYILGGLAIILAQSALIAELLLQRRRRQRAEVDVQRHRVELWHASRLATAGELMATIAHEVDQPLGAILVNVGAAEMLLKSGNAHVDEVLGILGDLRKDDLRASEVIQRLRALLAKHEMERAPLDLNVVIVEVLRLLEAESRRRQVALVRDLDASLPKVLGDRVHLQQVMLNLVLNAMDAMADTPEHLRCVVVHATRSADAVEVAVTDHGHGIAPERLPKLFESFFTTKEQGMGLGLSIARSIVEAHGGRIWATSDNGRGATFRFTLPGADTAPAVSGR
jgi:signal transduction histidine kinase